MRSYLNGVKDKYIMVDNMPSMNNIPWLIYNQVTYLQDEVISRDKENIGVLHKYISEGIANLEGGNGLLQAENYFSWIPVTGC